MQLKLKLITGLHYLTIFQQYFRYIVVVKFYWWWRVEYPEKTFHLSHVADKQEGL